MSELTIEPGAEQRPGDLPAPSGVPHAPQRSVGATAPAAAHESRTSPSELVLGRWPALLVGGLLFLLACALLFLVTGLLPGTGIEVLTLRTLLGVWLPALVCLGLQPTLRARGLGLLGAGLLLGMLLAGLALLGGGIGLGVALRVI